ncbi:NAD(P)H-binding protein [Nitratireductor sp. XY-223]|uniref:NAD(P)H-binding protein n=1 Tax=Nitratireductor sp. XY-223 TaxID=2561926 RepID=UPI0010AA6497|nr:NAD(P)H-binding protein [Nitratireductor sp. XY-223]
MSETILVTGATGTIGRPLARMLARDGCTVRAMSRGPLPTADRKDELIQPVAAHFDDPAALAAALEGADAAVLITPADGAAGRYARNFIEAARAGNLKRLVRVSALKAARDGPTENTRLHAETEDHIASSGLPHVVLRPQLFMQNLCFEVPSIRDGATFSFSTGDGHMGMIDTRDIAACAAKCVQSDDFLGRTLELTGPETLSWHDAASILSELSGRRISFVPVAPQRQYETMVAAGIDPWMAAVLRDYGAAYGGGWGDYVTDDVEQITGRPATDFRRFAADMIMPGISQAGE